jgi:hypothetical protein
MLKLRAELREITEKHIQNLKAASGCATPPEIITVQVHRGLITDVSGIPEGYELHVEDYDVDDTEHPQWNAEKECITSVYAGGSTSKRCWPCDLCEHVEIAPPRFDGDTQTPEMEPVCTSRCHTERFPDGDPS